MVEKISDELRSLLWDLVNYMEPRQDAWAEDGQWIANQEMRFAMELRERLGHFKPRPDAAVHEDHDYHKNRQEERDERGYFPAMAGRNEGGEDSHD